MDILFELVIVNFHLDVMMQMLAISVLIKVVKWSNSYVELLELVSRETE